MIATPRLQAIFLIAAFNLFAQQPSNPAAADVTIRLNVQQVLVPVVVTDNKGHHVSGLHASDFRISEDGVPQEIAAFSSDTTGSINDIGALSTPASNPAAPASPQAGPRRTYVICIDALHTSPANAVRVRQALESLFETEKTSDAQYVLISIGRQLQVLQTATANPLAILLKIRSVAFEGALRGHDAAALAAELNNLKNHMEQFCRRCSCVTRTSQRSCDSEVDALKQSVDGEAGPWTALTSGLLEQFRMVVEELGKLPTGRTLILVSDGFQVDAIREFYTVVSSYLPNRPQFKLEHSTDIEPGLQASLRIAVDRNINIYAIDSRGSYTSSFSSSGPMDASRSPGNGGYQSVTGINRPQTPIAGGVLQPAAGQPANLFHSEDSDTMEQLARATGGVYFHAAKDMLKQFRGALADGRQYYVLAYVPKNGAQDGRFRRITIEVANKKLSIRAKPGYWAGGSGNAQ